MEQSVRLIVVILLTLVIGGGAYVGLRHWSASENATTECIDAHPADAQSAC